MADAKIECRAIVAAALNEFKNQKNIEGESVSADAISVENPPRPEMGDIGMPLFPFAKLFRGAPPMIAAEVVRIIQTDADLSARAKAIGTFLAVGPYVNVKLDKAGAALGLLERIEKEGTSYGTLNETGTAHLARYTRRRSCRSRIPSV